MDDSEVAQVRSGVGRTIRREEARSDQPAEHLECLDINEVRRVEVAVLFQARQEICRWRPPHERMHDRGGVDDDHR